MYRRDTSRRDRGTGRMLEIAVLGLLNESPMHGYELRKRLANLLGTFRAFSYGSLYPTLRRLTEAGWLTEEPALDEPAFDGRERREGRRTRSGPRARGRPPSADSPPRLSRLLALVRV